MASPDDSVATHSSTVAFLTTVLVREFEVIESEVRLDARLGDDLDLDSLDLTELLQLIETHIDCEIADEQLADLVTLGDVVDLVVASAGAATSPAAGSAAAC